jgi:asparagine synthase (glutamine-hydrolysing)
MCGIAGIYNLNEAPVSLEALKGFTDSMIHRGPDGAGYNLFENNTLGLGQRRLSILDLSEAGKQPMSYANGRYWMTYNGEVFNFIEIKEELLKFGHTFKSETDSEVILAAYAQWGKACLDRFNGMWAFAIWDDLEKELFLARDRFGVKPLYYTFKPNHFFAFASETLAFKYLNGFERTLNNDKVKEVFQNGLALEGIGFTIYNDIYQILPGHTLTIKNDKTIPKQKRWYDIRERIKHKSNLTYQENVSEFYRIFENACKIRMRSDVPLASALSGGLDSSAVYSMVHFLSNKEIEFERKAKNWKKAITATFPNTPMDETMFAEKVANKWGVENWKCVINNLESLDDEIQNVTKHFDAISSTAMNSISKIYEGIRKEGITVSLDGHGVDEMLFGYRYMLDKLFYNDLETKNFKAAQLVKEVLVGLYEPNQRDYVNKRLSDLINQTKKSQKGLKSIIKALLKSKKAIKANKIEKSNILSDSLYHFEQFSFEERILLEDFFIYSLPTYLRDFDRASMMHSVEVRMPFMDYRLVEFCFSLPLEHKIGLGFTKQILRTAMKDIVPDEILERTYKIGIGSPLPSWFNSELNHYAINLLKNQEFKKLLLDFGFKESKYYQSVLENQSINNQDAINLWLVINYYILSKI